ncbi:Very long-chain acyl-CoA synthetase [Merluccius polli]|uniref:long-chain-fatty-acid--CoA ligase n=1 Tax=Merluccius polli TaxID=89951 RepID=A0AA47MPX1_MERPO|nr:Very long-chain acyl-CoA synthetase [Merluccius polli]
MWVIFSILAGLVLVPLFLYLGNPYFFKDLDYAVRAIRCGVGLQRKQKRCPSFLGGFLEKVDLHPQKAFVVFEDTSYSYGQADGLSNRVARVLSTHVQVKEGDTVAVFSGNEPVYIWTCLALAKLGCTASLLNSNIRSKSLLHCLSCCGAKVLLVAPDLRAAVEEVMPALLQQGVRVFVLSDDCASEGIESLGEKIQQASDQPVSPQLRANTTIKSPALYIYTSGTTGLPKAALVTHERLLQASMMYGLCNVRADDVLYLYLPLYHASGFFMGLCGAMDTGITVILRRKFSTSQFWNDCRKHNVTVIQYIGEIMRYLCNTPKTPSDRDHKVRMAIGNGIRADTWAEFVQRFGDIHICECYGATEGNVGFINYIGKVGAIGKENFLQRMMTPYALIKYDTEKEEPIRDSHGFCIEVPKGQTGLLVGKISGRAPFRGYANNKQQTERKKLKDVLVKGDVYFNTGDLLKIDQHGFVYFQDRIGDTFRWKGENVATTEVADHLLMVDCIEEANVYGVKVPGHEGRIGMAALTLKEGMDFDSSSTYQHVKSYLPAYARPQFIRIQEALVVTGTFKLMKSALVEEGFNPGIISDPLYYLSSQGYVPMTHDIFNNITEGRIRL